MLSWIGWIATAMFGVSYLCKRPSALRTVQALAALLWIVYGVIIHAVPVVAANVIVAGMAVFSMFTRSGSQNIVDPIIASPQPPDRPTYCGL
jgi:Trk-type K+ transport system membrane component